MLREDIADQREGKKGQWGEIEVNIDNVRRLSALACRMSFPIYVVAIETKKKSSR